MTHTLYRLLEESLLRPEDEMEFSLVFCNRTEEDVIFQARLEALQKQHPTRLSVNYVLSQPLDQTTQGTRVTSELLEKLLPSPDENPLMLCCGPPGLVKSVCKEILPKLGYDPKLVWEF
jgi:cytochrome-b5 reductase